MVRPISLRIRHAAMRNAHAALGAGRQEELRRAHYARVNQRAREIIARRQEEDRLARCARLSAHKAAFFAADAFEKISASANNDIDRQKWREARALVEAELRKIVEKASRR